MNITLENIKEYASKDIYTIGVRLFKQNCVELTHTELVSFTAVVEADDTFQVQVEQEGNKYYSSCSCPRWGTCEHVIAALLKAKDWYEINLENLVQSQNAPHWKDFFESVIDQQQLVPQNGDDGVQKWKIVYILNFDKESWSVSPQKAYIKKDGSIGRLANIGEFDPNSRELAYAPNDPVIISYLQKLEQQQNAFYNFRYYGNSHDYDISNYHFKYGSKLGPLLDFMRESTLLVDSGNETYTEVNIAGTSEIEFEFYKENNHICLEPNFIDKDNSRDKLTIEYHVLSEQPVWVLKNNLLYKISNQEYAGMLLPFTKDEIKVQIPKPDLPDFLEKIFPKISSFTSIPLPDSIKVEQENQVHKPVLNLSESDDHLEIDLQFDYNGHLVSDNDNNRNLFRKIDDKVALINRDMEFEENVRDSLLATGLKSSPKGPLRIIDSKVLKWMFKNIPDLSKKGYEIRGLEELERFRIRTGAPNVQVGVSTKIDWFDLNLKIDIEGIPLALAELKKAIKQNKKYVRLTDNSIAKLSDEWFKRFKHLFNFAESDDQSIKVAKYHVTLIDSLFSEVHDRELDAEYLTSLDKLHHFESIEPQPLPSALTGVMRDYQKSGYDWLYFLKTYNFGGCLADDMGLGKTLQTLALLLNEKQKGNKTPSLIMCPTSVVFNWEQEIKKFTPDLDVLIHTGIDRDRSPESFDHYDIILSSYGIVLRDILFLKDVDFYYIVLDESQKIKNPKSQTAKAVRLLKGRHRLVLTGTPVENNTVELWSQLSFLNPGLLGHLGYFKKYFTYPIEKKQDEGTTELLKQLIYPFILRRTKEHVAKELPPKVEQTIFCSMNPEQQQLYDYWKNRYRSIILNKIDTDGINHAHMNILEGLVKLRQIACHPSLIDSNIDQDSGKFEYIKETIEEIIAEDHKILLFSQFVRMLKLLRAYLDEAGIPYVYLDGNTRDRQECVERFQNDPNIKIFLISLKAGGTGLNLTKADYVIHYDPWWNPAVEVQATDRAHRIGQKNRVFVYRLITKNTVEEKMLGLQAKKEKLVSDLITNEKGFFKNLTREHIEQLFE